MKILITGGAGFVGSNLTEYFLRNGHEVIVVDNLITGQQKNFNTFSENPNFKFYNCSIESEKFKKLFSGKKIRIDRIYHLACPTGVPNIEILGDEMITACSFGTLNVLNLAVSTGAKFLFTSSSEVYGQPEVFPQSESYTGNVDALGPRANYEEGKRFSETLVRWFVKSRGLDARIVRFFNVYGPNMSLEDSRLLPRLATQALSSKPLTVQGDGKQRRTFCYITDILNGLELVMEKGTAGEAYNLGSDQEVAVIDFAKKIIKLTGSSSCISYVKRPEHDHNARLPELSKVYALGWKARVGLAYGLNLSLNYFRNQINHNSINSASENLFLNQTALTEKHALSKLRIFISSIYGN
jgi:nucleoside-diphosphate-sugar epimerase